MSTDEKTLPDILINVTRDQGGRITNVWLDNVPADWTDQDVMNALEDSDQPAAKDALTTPCIDMCWPLRTDGTRVYLDNA